MSLVGFQDFWIPGARVLIQKESAVSGVVNPLLDIGLISSVTPTITPNVLQLEDSDGGTKQLVDEALSSVAESYEVTTNNMNLDNLALLFLSDEPEITIQARQDIQVLHYVWPERLVKVIDSAGTPMFNLFSINGLISEAGTEVTHNASLLTDAIDATAQTIDLDASEGDVTTAFVTGELFILTGTALQNPSNPGTYKVLSSAFISVTYTEITIDTSYRSLAATETPGAGPPRCQVIAKGTAIIYQQDRDWEVGSDPTVDPTGGISGPASRGYFRITQPATTQGAGIIVAPGNLFVNYSLASGAPPSGSHIPYIRQIRPQSLSTVLKAKVWIYVGLENDARGYVREFDASITPNGMNLGDGTGYADMTLTIKVLNDLSSLSPAGRLKLFEGDVGAQSALR